MRLTDVLALIIMSNFKNLLCYALPNERTLGIISDESECY